MSDFNIKNSQALIALSLRLIFKFAETPWNFDQSRATFQDQRGLVGELSKCCLNCAPMVGWFTPVGTFKGCLISKDNINFVPESQKVFSI